MNVLQAERDKRYHKGSAAYNLGCCYLQQGDSGRALWFFVCAYIDDVLTITESTIPQFPATQALRLHFNWSPEHFEVAAAVAREVRTTYGNRCRYPEMTIVTLARRGEFSSLPSKSGAGVPINKPLLKELIGDLPAGDNNKKKDSLEFLASYLAITLPGVRIKAGHKAIEHGATCEHELDLVVTQYGSVPTYLLEALGRHFLVECKNWNKSVGARDLNHFVAKMRFHRCKCGVIFSNKGLSGDENNSPALKHARVTQLRWYQQDDCVVIVLTKEHLNKLASGQLRFAEALLRGYEAVRFSSTKELLE